MNSVIKEKTEVIVPCYPKLMICEKDNLIVLFYSEECGTVVHEGDNTYYSMGDIMDNWDKCQFVTYDKAVELSN